MLLKINYFLRVYTKFGLLVNLLSTCVQDILPFTFYLFIWEVLFVMLYKLCGISEPERLGFKQGGFWSMFLYVWENSIGNITDPEVLTFKNAKF